VAKGERGPAAAVAVPPGGTLRGFVLYFLKLGTLGFGGPIALAGYMQRDLVEQRRWISPEDYQQGLALAQLAPGPLAAQLAIYLGWVRAGVLGASLVGLAFVGPSFAMVLGLSALYVNFGGLPWVQGAFYGIGAAVIAIIARSAVKLARMTVGTDRLLWVLFGVSALVTAWTESEIISVFVACGLVAMVVRAGEPIRLPGNIGLAVAWPAWLMAGSSLASASAGILGTIFWYFAAAGLFVFGSGLAIVPFLHGGVVQQFHWLTERQFLDAVAISLITPGPVVITVSFIGYLVAGFLGALVAAIGVFAPVFLVVVLVAPYFRRVTHNPRVRAFVMGVTAAAGGAIAGATYVLGRRAFIDTPTVLIGVVTLALLPYMKKLPEPLLIVAAGLVGLVLHRPVTGGEMP